MMFSLTSGTIRLTYIPCTLFTVPLTQALCIQQPASWIHRSEDDVEGGAWNVANPSLMSTSKWRGKSGNLIGTRCEAAAVAAGERGTELFFQRQIEPSCNMKEN